MFVAPSVIFGFIFAIAAIGGINTKLFDPDMGVEATPLPSSFAVLQAVFIGLVIPFLSSVVPIQTALSKNRNDSLDVMRSTSAAVMVGIIDPKKTNLTTYVVFGLVSVLYGMSIYYFLPLSMLSFNFSMVLKIFIFILVGMGVCLTLLAFNL